MNYRFYKLTKEQQEALKEALRREIEKYLNEKNANKNKQPDLLDTTVIAIINIAILYNILNAEHATEYCKDNVKFCLLDNHNLDGYVENIINSLVPLEDIVEQCLLEAPLLENDCELEL